MSNAQVVQVEWTGYEQRMTILFYCERCRERFEYTYSTLSRSTMEEWQELAEKSAAQHHEQVCPPRRGLYRKALGLALRIGSE